MNVLLIGNFGTSWDGSVCDEKHIAEALKSLGHGVCEMQRENIPMGQVSAIHGFELVLIAQWNGYPEHVCNKLREMYNCPVVYWAFDYQWDSNEEWHFEMAVEADLFLSKEMDNRTEYEEIGANFHWLPQDFAPDSLRPIEGLNLENNYEVVFTGSYLPQAEFRNKLLKAVDDEFDLHIFTVTPDGFKDFKNVHSPIMDDGLIKLYQEAKIVLSVDWKQAEGYWSDRMSQVLACGGYVINLYVPMQELDYPDVVHFNTIEECLKLIRKGPGKRGQKPIYVTDRVKQMLMIVRYQCLA